MIKSDTNEVRLAISAAASDAVKLIASATSDAAHTIADAASQARAVVVANATEAAKVLNIKNADGGSDHDLLTQIGVKVDRLTADIKELKDGTSSRISTLEKYKVDTKDSYPVLYKKDVDDSIKDHEDRLRDIDDKVKKAIIWGSVGLFALGASETLFNIFHK